MKTPAHKGLLVWLLPCSGDRGPAIVGSLGPGYTSHEARTESFTANRAPSLRCISCAAGMESPITDEAPGPGFDSCTARTKSPTTVRALGEAFEAGIFKEA